MIVKEEYLKKNLKIVDVVLLNCILRKEYKLLDYLLKNDSVCTISMNLLKKRGIVIIAGNEHYVTSKEIKGMLLGSEAESIKVTDLVDQYRDLFPKGTNRDGYPYKGDKQGCVKKMNRFIKLNPEFTPDVILQATQKYINEKRKDNFNYMHLAHYFIEKNGVSALSAFCEQILEGGDNGNFTNIIEF